MIIVGGIKIQPIEELSDEDLVSIVDQVLHFANGNPQGQERTIYDFKESLPYKKREEKDEIRRRFAAFANTMGGLFIVGVVDRTLQVQGIPQASLIDLAALTQILSDRNTIRPPIGGSCHSRVVTYHGVTLQILEIPASDELVEVKDTRRGEWISWCRRNNTIDRMTLDEEMRKHSKNVLSLPAHLKVDLDKLGIYSTPNSKPGLKVEWDLRAQGKLYDFLKIPYGHLLPLPFPTVSCPIDRKAYMATSRYLGEGKEIGDMLDQIEKTTQSIYGVGFEVWTVSIAGAKVYTEDHRYASGTGATSLTSTIHELIGRQPHVRFGWGIFTGSVLQLVTGFVDSSHFSIVISSFLNSIPNGFEFLSVSPKGRVMVARLPVHELGLDVESIVKGVLGVSQITAAGQNMQTTALDVSLVGFLGGKPEPPKYGGLVGGRGLTLFKLGGPESLGVSATPLATHSSLLFGRIANYPMGLNPFKPATLHSLNSWAFPLVSDIALDTTLVLFGNEVGLDQNVAYLLTE
jgi:hypothetical protein